MNNQFGLKLVDSLSDTAFLSVKLPRNLRNSFNPQLNPSAQGLKVRISGKRDKYVSHPGLQNLSSIQPIP